MPKIKTLTKSWHLRHGYMLASPDAVEQPIRKALGIYQAKSAMGWVGHALW